MSKICTIHGLNSSYYSFAYLARELEIDSKINYLSFQPLADSLLQVSKQLPKDEPITLIGHSLGGLIALLLAQNGTHQIERVITISSPVGGSKAAVYARWVASGMPILNDITPNSLHVRALSRGVSCPVLSVISTGGNLPTSNEPNDSVVTIASQRSLPYGKKVEIKANHFEILLREETIKHIQKFNG